MRIVIALVGIVLLASVGTSATIYVPDNYPTIQAAIDASMNGDTVVVRPGTYFENIYFYGKEITVKSGQGSAVTSIDGKQVYPVVLFNNGEGKNSKIEGFTITNGFSFDGGGIHCYGSSPTISNNVISGNRSVTYGGGICCQSAAAVISKNTISGNWSDNGGGIACRNCSPDIADNMISGNTVNRYGGGIYCYNSKANISNNTISENTAHYGAGIYIPVLFGHPTITNNTIRMNKASAYGGGIKCSAPATIENNAFAGNVAYRGGGFYCYSSQNLCFRNNIVTENRAIDGGGIYLSDCNLTLTFSNNTISRNLAQSGGGIHCYKCPTRFISNTILWDNTASKGPEIHMTRMNLTISYSNVSGGPSSVYNAPPGGTLIWGAGMIDSDPLFADPTNNDYHLTWSSPCRNTGDNNAVTELYDFEGDPRIAGKAVDMGADEFYYHLYSVGDVLPGSPIDIKVVGIPGLPALLALGTSIQDPPFPTPHGDLWLTMPLAKSWQLGVVPTTGILTHTATVPSGWPSGSQHPFQALVGPWGGGATRLTNMMALVVE